MHGASRVEFMVAVAPGLGLLIRYACISILKHDEWSRHGDFGGEREREREAEGERATMKIVRSWRPSTVCHPGNRSADPPPDGLLRLPDTAPVKFEYRVALSRRYHLPLTREFPTGRLVAPEI